MLLQFDFMYRSRLPVFENLSRTLVPFFEFSIIVFMITKLKGNALKRWNLFFH